MTLQYTMWYRHWKTISSCNKTSSSLLSGRRAGTWPFVQRSTPHCLSPEPRRFWSSPTSSTATHLRPHTPIKKDLGWNTHVDNICARANKTLGFLWRNLKIGLTSIKQTTYKSFLRPNLEYTSIVWDPHTQHAIDKIYNEELPDMSLGATTTALASRTYSELQWPSLQQCRHIAWLTTCTKSTTTMSVPLDWRVGWHCHHSAKDTATAISSHSSNVALCTINTRSYLEP